MKTKGADESRDGVPLTNLDQPLFDGAGATKRDLVDYLDAVSDRILPVLKGRISAAPLPLARRTPRVGPAVWLTCTVVGASSAATRRRLQRTG